MTIIHKFSNQSNIFATSNPHMYDSFEIFTFNPSMLSMLVININIKEKHIEPIRY